MTLESLNSVKFHKISQAEQKNIRGGEIANSGGGKRATGRTRVVNGVTQYEWQTYTSDCSKQFLGIDGKLHYHTTYAGTAEYWV